MPGDVQFGEKEILSKKVLPLGEGFLEKEQMGLLKGSSATKNLDKTISSFHKSIKNGSRRSRSEAPFISKAKYILASKKSFAAEADRTPDEINEELISLLADSATLFSFGYQQYMTDHEFFRAYRKRHGKTRDERLRFCRNKALQNIPDERRKCYEELLIKFQAKMDKEKWPAKKAEEEFASELINREISAEELDCFLTYFRHIAPKLGAKTHEKMEESYPEISLTVDETKKLVCDYAQLSSNANAKDYLDFYKHGLAYYLLPALFENEYASMAYKALNRWLPSIEIGCNEAGQFVANVLKTYLFYRMDIHRVKASCGQYRRSYRVYDKEAHKRYLDRKEFLEDTAKRHMAWRSDDLASLIESILEYDNFSSAGRKNDIPEIKQAVESLCLQTSEYLKNTRSGAKNFKAAYAKLVIYQLYLAEDEQLTKFPFLYLMICIAGTSRLFSSETILSSQSMVKAIDKPYYQKPSIAKQRICRIQFLNELNKICNLDRESRSMNWKLFLQVHGSVIESPEEAELWKKIIYGGTVCSKNQQEDIPPIELSLICNDFLRSCLPIQEQFMYCYRGGSYVQAGGYAKFLKECPHVLNECVKRINRDEKKLGYPSKKYLKLWSGISCDAQRVKELCAEISSHIRWGSVPGASDKELQEFLVHAHHYEENSADNTIIGKDIDNLRVLLVETSLRKILTKNAAKVLRSKTEIVFNQSSDFKIGLSKF